MSNTRRTLSLAVAALALVACSASAGAQVVAPATGDTITFDRAIGIALRQNTSLLASQNASALSETQVKARQNAFLPSLSLNTSGAETVGRSFNQTEGSVVDRTTQTLSTGLSSSMTVYDGGQNTSALREARLGAAASGSDLTRAKQTTVFTVASDYLTLVSRQEQLRVQRENLASLQAQEAQVQKFVDAGMRPIGDLYQQQATTASAVSAVVSAQHDVELAKIALIQTLQLDPRGDWQFKVPSIATTDTASIPALDVLLDRAYANRSDLTAEEKRLAAASEGVKGAAAGKKPTVSVSAGYNTAYSSATDLALADQLNQRRGGSVSLGVSLPIFDRGATSVATQQAKIQEDNAKLALANVRQQVALEVRRAYLDVETARQQLAAAEAQQKAADLAVSTTQQRYQLGSSTLLELTQARATQLQAASAVVNARYTLVFDRALMGYYTGELAVGAPLMFGE